MASYEYQLKFVIGKPEDVAEARRLAESLGAGPERVINYLMHNARPFMFSASASPASVAAVLAALDVMAEEPERFERLWENARILKSGFDRLGFDTGHSASPIGSSTRKASSSTRCCRRACQPTVA